MTKITNEVELKAYLAEHGSVSRFSTNANLRGANLVRADLRDADLSYADLYGANLRGADLRDANLYGAELYGANLYGAIIPLPIGMTSRNFDIHYSCDENGQSTYHAGCFSDNATEMIEKTKSVRDSENAIRIFHRCASFAYGTSDYDLFVDAILELRELLKGDSDVESS